MLHLHTFMQEDLSRLLEFFLTFSSQIQAGTFLGNHILHVLMPLQVIFQTLSYIHSLWHNPHTIGKVFHNAVHQQWIMCTSQDNRIYVSIFTHQLVNALLDEIISTRTISLIGFYDSRP